MKNQVETVKAQRLVARTDVETQQLIARAAALAGRSVAQFVLYAAKKEALDVVKQAERVQITRKSADRMLGLLDNPEPLSPKLREAALNHRDIARGFAHRRNRKST